MLKQVNLHYTRFDHNNGVSSVVENRQCYRYDQSGISFQRNYSHSVIYEESEY
jgi:hypothetical protein